MAGFNDSFDVKFTEGVRQLLLMATRLASAGSVVDGRTSIDFWLEGHTVNYLADGSMLGLEVALEALSRELPVAAKALSTVVDSNVERVGTQIIKNVVGLGSSLFHAAQSRQPAARPIQPSLPALRETPGRIDAYRSAIVGLARGTTAPSTALEEIHSTIETLLRKLVANPPFSFPDLVDKAIEDLLIEATDAVAIKEMNVARKAAKHHGAEVPLELAIQHYFGTHAVVVLLATRLALGSSSES